MSSLNGLRSDVYSALCQGLQRLASMELKCSLEASEPLSHPAICDIGVLTMRPGSTVQYSTAQ